MIRITFLLRRKPELTREAFQDYWLNEHGPLVASHARHIHAMRYVQVHAIDHPANAAMAEARGGMEAPYDGVAEVTFENRDALVAALSEPAGQAAAAALLEDEARFIDLPNSPLWIGYEYPQVNPTPENLVAGPRSPLAKLYFPLREQPGRDPAEVQFYWRTRHGPIIRRHAQAMAVQRYVQVHRALDDELQSALTASRGTVVEPYLGHAELWFDPSDTRSSKERSAGGRAALEDESTFIDFKRSAMWLGKEHVFVDHR
ncbi:MAG: EthD domain-containing protein [Pseudomonadota bacterium]